MSEVFHNWAGNQVFAPAEVRTPSSVEEVARAVQDGAATGRRVRMIGTGHSFTGVALTDGLLLRPNALTGIREVDRDGCGHGRGRDDARRAQRGARPAGPGPGNMGDINAQTVAGAIQTGTHGTGRDDRRAGRPGRRPWSWCSPTARSSVHRAARTTDGARTCSTRPGSASARSACVTAVTFRVEPSFLLRGARGSRCAGRRSSTRFDELAAGNEHFEFYWFPHTDACLTKRNNREPTGRPSRSQRVRGTGWTTSSWRTRCSARCAASAAGVPGAIPRLNRSPARRSRRATYTDASYKVFTSVAASALPGDGVRRPARAARPGACARPRDLVERRDWRITLPDRGAGHPGRRRVAVHRVRQGHGLPRLPHLPADRRTRPTSRASRRS